MKTDGQPPNLGQQAFNQQQTPQRPVPAAPTRAVADTFADMVESPDPAAEAEALKAIEGAPKGRDVALERSNRMPLDARPAPLGPEAGGSRPDSTQGEARPAEGESTRTVADHRLPSPADRLGAPSALGGRLDGRTDVTPAPAEPASQSPASASGGLPRPGERPDLAATQLASVRAGMTPSPGDPLGPGPRSDQRSAPSPALPQAAAPVPAGALSAEGTRLAAALRADVGAGLVGGAEDRAAAMPRPAIAGANPQGAERAEAQMPFAPGDAILRALGGGPPAETAATTQVGRLIHDIADRVLVSDPRHGDGREIQIAIKDSVFPGLEVRLSQTADGLMVSLAAREGDVAFLQTQAAMLAEHLGNRLRRTVEVRVIAEDGDVDPDGVVRRDPDEPGDPPPQPAPIRSA